MTDRPVVTVPVGMPEDLLSGLSRDFDVVQLPPGTRPDPDGLVGWLADGSVRIDEELLSALPGLRVVTIDGVGHDFVDLTATRARGIAVGNVAGVVDDAVAELALALILALGRDVVDGDRYCRDGRWIADGPDARVGDQVTGSRVGILGMGRIGSRLAELLVPLRMDVVYVARRPRPELEAAGIARPIGRDELFASSDFVVSLLPASAETRGSIGAHEFGLMRSTARFLNLGRGSVVHTPALVRALHDGAIAGAALDVMEHEPIPAGDELLTAPRMILQPHVGAATHRTRRAMLQAATEDLRRGALGLPLRIPVIG